MADPGRGFLDTTRLERLATYEAPADVDVDGRLRVRTSVGRVRPAPAPLRG